MGFLKKTKSKFENFLEKLAEDNKKNFGEGSLDCCELNSEKNTNKINRKK